MLKFLDKFEDVPALYQRRQVEVKAENDATFQCWLYAMQDFKPETLNLKFLKSFSASDKETIKYVPR